MKRFLSAAVLSFTLAACGGTLPGDPGDPPSVDAGESGDDAGSEAPCYTFDPGYTRLPDGGHCELKLRPLPDAGERDGGS